MSAAAWAIVTVLFAVTLLLGLLLLDGEARIRRGMTVLGASPEAPPRVTEPSGGRV